MSQRINFGEPEKAVGIATNLVAILPVSNNGGGGYISLGF
jgi:hypothetical protein